MLMHSRAAETVSFSGPRPSFVIPESACSDTFVFSKLKFGDRLCWNLVRSEAILRFNLLGYNLKQWRSFSIVQMPTSFYSYKKDTCFFSLEITPAHNVLLDVYATPVLFIIIASSISTTASHDIWKLLFYHLLTCANAMLCKIFYNETKMCTLLLLWRTSSQWFYKIKSLRHKKLSVFFSSIVTFASFS